MHFRNNTLLETFNAYFQAAGQWRYHYNRCALFEDGILSCVLLAAPANDAQRFSQGLYHLQNKGDKFTRTLTLRDGKNNFYLVGRGGKSVDFSLGGSCVDIYFGWLASRGCWARLIGSARYGRVYQILCRTKTSNLQSLCEQSSLARSLDV